MTPTKRYEHISQDPAGTPRPLPQHAQPGPVAGGLFSRDRFGRAVAATLRTPRPPAGSMGQCNNDKHPPAWRAQEADSKHARHTIPESNTVPLFPGPWLP